MPKAKKQAKKTERVNAVKPGSLYKTDIDFNGDPVRYVTFGDNESHTREEWYDKLTAFKDKLLARGFEGRFMTSLQYPKGFRSGPQTASDEDLKFYTNEQFEYGEEDPEAYKYAVLYIIGKVKK